MRKRGGRRDGDERWESEKRERKRREEEKRRENSCDEPRNFLLGAIIALPTPPDFFLPPPIEIGPFLLLQAHSSNPTVGKRVHLHGHGFVVLGHLLHVHTIIATLRSLFPTSEKNETNHHLGKVYSIEA